MKVSELIEQLKKYPQDAEVKKVSYDGCLECNSEGMGYYNGVFSTEYLEVGEYPNDRDYHIVVL